MSFSKDRIHVEPSWKQSSHPKYGEVLEYFRQGTNACAKIIEKAIQQIDESSEYVIIKDTTESHKEQDRPWWAKPSVLAAAATIIAAIFTSLGAIGAAYITSQNSRSIDTLIQSSIIDKGEMVLQEGRCTDIFARWIETISCEDGNVPS